MTLEPAPDDNTTPADPSDGRRKSLGAVGLVIVALVIVMALIVVMFGPTNTQQASNVPASPPPSTQTP